jgi:membrane protease YdiL (CAAX protease family)
MSRAAPPSSIRAIGLFAVGAGLPNLLALVPLRPLLIAGLCALYWLVAAGYRVNTGEGRGQRQKAFAAGAGVGACLCWAWSLHRWILGESLPHFETPWLTKAVEEPQWAGLFIVVFLAPVAEERFFRGALFASLEAGGRKWVAVVGSTLAFAVAHPYGAPAAMAVGAGLSLGLVRAWTGDWRAAAAVHAVFNGTVWLVIQQSV